MNNAEINQEKVIEYLKTAIEYLETGENLLADWIVAKNKIAEAWKILEQRTK